MSKSILVIEDSVPEMIYLKGLIGKLDEYTADEAPDHKAAMDKLAVSKYDLIILDYYMPGESAEDFFYRFRSENMKDNENTPVIVLGRTSDFDGNFLKKTGFANYLEKPVEFNMLKAAIEMYSK